MELLFLGTTCDSKEEIELMKGSRVGLQNSVIKFQNNIIHGIEGNLNKRIDIISILPVGTYPKYYNKLFIKKKKSTETKITTLGIVNLPILKQVMLTIGAIIEIIKWIKKNKNSKKYIIMYDLLFPHLVALRVAKIIYPDIITCSVVADLLNEYGYEKNDVGIKKQFKKILGKYQMNTIKKLDCFGLLTEYMRFPLKLEKDYIIIEGIADLKDNSKPTIDEKNKIILYSGSLHKVYGINNLVEAFINIKHEDYELWICGVGDYLDELKKQMIRDERIKYFGFLSQNEVGKLQSKATVLINPRQNIGEYTKYSFPSKTMEYLVTAKPVITYKLDGIPLEYYDFLIAPLDNTVQELSNTIIRICDLSIEERRKIGEKGRKFVLEKKNPLTQCEKLINLLKKQN